MQNEKPLIIGTFTNFEPPLHLRPLPLVVCQDSFERLGTDNFGFRLPRRFAPRNASQFWILENHLIPHFKIDRAVANRYLLNLKELDFLYSLQPLMFGQ